MKRLILVVLLSVLVLTLCSCSPYQTTDTGRTIQSQVDPNVYTVVITLEQEDGYTEGHASIGGSSVNGFGYVSGRYWEDGKGIIRGKLQSVSPEVKFVDIGDTFVIKTTDRKVMGLVPGDTVTFLCIADYEPVCALNEENSVGAGDCVDIWEFDYCRIDSIIPAETDQ